MLFDERPKSNREDLFDRDRELGELLDNIHRPIILLTGIRRIGKTSILRVALNMVDTEYILIDGRGLKPNYGLRDMYSLLSSAFSRSGSRILELIKGLRGVKVLGSGVEFSWGGRESLDLIELFDRLNRRRVIVAIDEAQYFRGPQSNIMRNLLAHSYDYNDNVTFILTGSEVGLLHDFLLLDEPDSPLYGRYIHNITVERFSRDESFEFLKRGFNEAGVEIDHKLIEEAVDLFDGIPGWLTFFGNRYISGIRRMEDIIAMAVNMAVKELRSICRTDRYRYVLKGIAEGLDSWSKIKRYVEEREKRTISDSILSNIIRNLEDMSIISKYKFLDPIYLLAARKL